jgi:hypothetical protein
MKKWARGASRKDLRSATMIAGHRDAGVRRPASRDVQVRSVYSTQVPEERDLYRLMIEVFHRRVIPFYVVTLTIIGLHLRHGFRARCSRWA